MTSLRNRDFELLELDGSNYLSWSGDARIGLLAKKLFGTVQLDIAPGEEDNIEEMSNRASALQLLRHHLPKELAMQYMSITEPKELWDCLKARFDHQKTVLLPRARADWNALRFLDYKTVAEYNSELFRITNILKMCGVTITDEEMILKTLDTVPISMAILAQNYRDKAYKTFAELIGGTTLPRMPVYGTLA